MTDQSLRLAGVAIFDRWTALWNHDLHLAEEIMAPWFTLRYAQANGELFDPIHRPSELASMIDSWHEKRPGIVFRAEGEAVVDLTLVGQTLVGLVARPYFVSFNGEDAQPVARSGTDILKITDGLIAEVWSVSSGAAGRTFYR